MKRAVAALLLFIAGSVAGSAQNAPVPIEVTASTIETFTITDPESGYGEIAFRGGLVLRSPYEHFGALSGLEILPDGRLMAVADTGFWLTGTLIEEDGWLRGIDNVAITPILDADGDPGNRKSSADAEGLRFDPRTGTLLVSFEQNHRVSRFDPADVANALPTPVSLPALTGLRGNRGIEAVAVAPEGGPLGEAIVILSETSSGGEGIRGWVVGGPEAGTFTVRRIGTFSITDAVFLPNGDLFILERNFSLSEGIGMRIRRLSAADIHPGAVVDGPVILFDDHLFQIDNMEGMALRELPDGDVLITLVSDNNHSLLQRTLLLQFVWRETIPPEPAPRPDG